MAHKKKSSFKPRRPKFIKGTFYPADHPKCSGRSIVVMRRGEYNARTTKAA